MKRWLIMMSLLIASTVYAGSPAVPDVFFFQSALSDDGGNPLSDGRTDITFRIVDEAGKEVYVERQQVDVVRGRISALVGNGVDPSSSAPTGGLPIDKLLPSQRYFLEVEADGVPSTGPLEMASVPYALYSHVALRVAKDGVSGESIAGGSLAARHFSDEGVQGLAALLLQRNLLNTFVKAEDLNRTYNAPNGASRIGMNGGLRYSARSDVEGTIRDLDRAVAARQASIAAHEVAIQNLDRAVAARQASLAAHEARDVAAAHSGLLPIARLSEDIATQSELDGHRGANIASAHPNGTIPIGRLDTDIATQQELNAAEARLSGPIGNISQALANTPQIRAWGRIANTTTVVAGYNVRGAATSTSGQRITFGTALLSENYAVVVTPLNSIGQSPVVFSLATDGFEIRGVSNEYSFVIVQ